MRKQVFGRRFKRDKNERKALFRGLISSMILRGQIKTTEEKAKAIKGDLEKLVTKAKKGEVSRRSLQSDLKPFEIDKMVNQIAPGFKNRAGGYTRIIKMGKRFNDDASMVIMQWSEMEAVTLPVKKAELKTKKAPTKKVPAKTPRAKTAKPAVKKVARKAAK